MEGATRRPVEIGYTLSSEERQPEELVENAAMAEAGGFTFAMISDHFHPWTDRQGSSPFVWAVLGGIAAKTRTLRVGTGVTCPIIRMHPAIVAQASATVAKLMRGRFFLSVGSGENLNEHVTGQAWPAPEIRQDHEFVKAGFDHVYVHQIGPDQAGFMRFYEREVLDRVSSLAA